MNEENATTCDAKQRRPWAKWLAIGGFWFFLLKGLAWLAVAGAAWVLATD